MWKKFKHHSVKIKIISIYLLLKTIYFQSRPLLAFLPMTAGSTWNWKRGSGLEQVFSGKRQGFWRTSFLLGNSPSLKFDLLLLKFKSNTFGIVTFLHLSGLVCLFWNTTAKQFGEFWRTCVSITTIASPRWALPLPTPDISHVCNHETAFEPSLHSQTFD